ncbi:MAG: RNA 3'-terminal phosphate cyclase [Acidobacteriota bacterium]
MIEIDGSTHSGSGTLLRYSVALATITGEPLHMVRIRARRDKLGLRPQHLEAVRACASLCSGTLEGGEVGSREIRYYPGKHLRGGSYEWDIGTAGSTTMLAFAAIPVALFADAPCRFTITGGVFQDFAPSGFHLQHVLFPLLRRMGADVRMEIVRPGYVPQGQGRLRVEVSPMGKPLSPLRMLDQGKITSIRGISLASHLTEGKVAERMAEQCRKRLSNFEPVIDVVDDASATQPGAALLLWAETTTGCLVGSDQAGKRGRRSESIADFVTRTLIEDIESGATTDRHLADQLILFAALAKGATEYRIPRLTDHVESNLWLVERILGAHAEVKDNLLRVEGVGRRAHD